jgi:ribosomal protein L7/L12
MGGKMSRNKGKSWERTVAAAFRELFGDQVRRGWQTREGHDEPDVTGVPRFHIEAKAHKLVNIAAAIRQAVTDRTKAKQDGKKWIVAVTKSDRCVPLATMPFDEFMELVKEWYAAPVDQVAATVQSTAELLGWKATMMPTTPLEYLALAARAGLEGISIKAHLSALDVVLDEVEPSHSIETSRGDRIRSLAARARDAEIAQLVMAGAPLEAAQAKWAQDNRPIPETTPGEFNLIPSAAEMKDALSDGGSLVGKITAIKAMRVRTGCGLKEAKDAIEKALATVRLEQLAPSTILGE